MLMLGSISYDLSHSFTVMTMLLWLQIFGPCAIPFGLEKQTLLRVALQEVLREEVNIYVSMVKMVRVLQI